MAWPLQGAGFNQNSHYALVRALADGTAQIDRTRHEVGDLSTQDVIFLDGHVYSNKAPGLAFVTLPAYLVLDTAGVVGDGDPTRILWALGLVGCVLPAVLLLLLIRWAGDRIEHGFGTLAAVTVGLGTLALPFSTLFFSHALSALLVFTAFALLLYERSGPPRLRLVALAGLVAGLSIVTEYPNALAGLVLCAYAAFRAGRRLARVAVYAGAGFAGITPLLTYNHWAFGSPLHISYAGQRVRDGKVVERTTTDFGDSGTPSFLGVLESLFSTSGLLTLAPVLACGVVAAAVLHRRGRRGESFVVLSVGILYVIYNSSFGTNFGGFSAGQRYLIAIIPFLGLGLAAAFRTFPATTTALGLVSAVIAVSTTATSALAGYNLEWFDRVAAGSFTYTPASLVGVTGWYTMLPFFAAAGAAAVLAVRATPRMQILPVDVALAGTAVLAWALLAANAPKTPALGGDARSYGAYLMTGIALGLAGLAAAAAFRQRSRGVGRTTFRDQAGKRSVRHGESEQSAGAAVC